MWHLMLSHSAYFWYACADMMYIILLSDVMFSIFMMSAVILSVILLS
jgi:hypothetical protein